MDCKLVTLPQYNLCSPATQRLYDIGESIALAALLTRVVLLRQRRIMLARLAKLCSIPVTGE
jgi:hypothetical protein